MIDLRQRGHLMVEPRHGCGRCARALLYLQFYRPVLLPSRGNEAEEKNKWVRIYLSKRADYHSNCYADCSLRGTTLILV